MSLRQRVVRSVSLSVLAFVVSCANGRYDGERSSTTRVDGTDNPDGNSLGPGNQGGLGSGGRGSSLPPGSGSGNNGNTDTGGAGNPPGTPDGNTSGGGSNVGGDGVNPPSGAGANAGGGPNGAGGAAAPAPRPDPPPDARPTPDSSGVSGAFRVNASGRLTHNGAEFQVRGGNWFGLEGQDDLARPGAMELYIGSVFWADASARRTIEQTMQELAASELRLNTIRVPISPQTLVPGHPDGDYTRTDRKIRNNDPDSYPYDDALGALEDFLIKANENNLYVILDMHSCSNHIGWRAGKIDDAPPWVDANRENYDYKKEDYTCKTGEDAYDKTKWLADIRTMAALPKKLGISNVIGIDCFNEPHKYSWSEWADLAKECYDAVAAEDDDLIVIVEGVSGSHELPDGTLAPEYFGEDADLNPNWGENLWGQQNDPIQVPRDRLCFSPHTYGPSVFVQKHFIDQSAPACVGLEDDAAGKAKCQLVTTRDNPEAVEKLRRGWDQHFGYLREQNYCVIIGEFGGTKTWPDNPVEPEAATLWAHLPKDVRYDWEWQVILVDYMRDKGITDFTYWSINPESGDTGGLYNHAYSNSNKSGWGVWQGFDTEKISLLAGLVP